MRSMFTKSLYFISLFLLWGCHFKDICPECDTVNEVLIKFDWSKIDFVPDGMTVLLYDTDGNLVETFSNVPSEGRIVKLKSGGYSAACYNNDTEYVQWRNLNNINTLEAYTTETDILADHSRNRSTRTSSYKVTNEKLTAMPDMLCGECLWDIDVMTKDDDVQVILFTPTLLVDVYIYEFTNISNTEHITNIRATLSGLNEGLYIADQQESTESCTMPFSGNVDETKENTITGTMVNFGFTKDKSNLLTLYLWTKGNNIKSTWDVTKAVENAPDPHYVVIIIDTPIEVSPPIEGDDGINPEVNDWIIINETIIL